MVLKGDYPPIELTFLRKSQAASLAAIILCAEAGELMVLVQPLLSTHGSHYLLSAIRGLIFDG